MLTALLAESYPKLRRPAQWQLSPLQVCPRVGPRRTGQILLKNLRGNLVHRQDGRPHASLRIVHGALLFRHRNPKLFRQGRNRLLERNFFVFHDELNHIPPRPAPKALVKLLRRVNIERWRLLAVKWTKADITTRPALLQRDVGTDHFHDINGALQLCGKIHVGMMSSMTRLLVASLLLPALALAAELKFEDFVVDTPGLWTVNDGVITGKHSGLQYNDFLRTKKHYSNFRLALQFQLVGGIGNSGVQFRSKPVPDSHEVAGYQADVGEKYWGALYDESRRKKVLAQTPVTNLDTKAWHKYVITADGDHITLELDGKKTVDYREAEPGMDRTGFLALQVHSGPGIEVHFKDLQITELPPGPAIGENGSSAIPNFANLVGPKGLFVLFVRSADW